MFQHFLGIGGVFQNVQQFAQPAVLRDIVGVGRALFVVPMGGDTEFRDLVHLAGADLQFDALLMRAEHAGV